MAPFPQPDEQPLVPNNDPYPPPSNNGSRHLTNGHSLELDTPESVPVFEDQGERFDRARNSALKVYVVLILVGVVIGGLSLFGIVLLMQHFGLTDVPAQVDQN